MGIQKKGFWHPPIRGEKIFRTSGNSFFRKVFRQRNRTSDNIFATALSYSSLPPVSIVAGVQVGAGDGTYLNGRWPLPTKKKKTHSLTPLLYLYLYSVFVCFCICIYTLCLCIFVFVSLLCVCVFVKKHSLTPLPWVDFISRPLINYWLKWKSAGISDISNFNAKDQSCLLTFAICTRRHISLDFLPPSLGMWWHGGQMAGVLLIRELDFLSSESPGRCSAQGGDTISLLPRRRP